VQKEVRTQGRVEMAEGAEVHEQRVWGGGNGGSGRRGKRKDRKREGRVVQKYKGQTTEAGTGVS
jgi:hypothetical protein